MIYKLIGTVFVILGFFLNEWTIKFISGYEVQYDTAGKSLINLFMQALLICTGFYIIIKKKKAVQNVLLLTLTFLILTILLEAILSIPLLQNLSSDKPIWVPYKYKQISININRSHEITSLNNKYGFNDINHSYFKDNVAQIRIAILGDSFIWGAGIPDSVIWTRKLEKLYESNGYNCEIFNWGKSGWSTLDQYDFLKKEGYKYQFDYLVFAFVVNDIVIDSSSHKQLFYPDGFIYNKVLEPLSSFFPNTISLFTDLTNNFLSTYFNYGYQNWLKNIYTNNNLKNYSKLLKEIREYCENANIRFSFIMTPENHNPLLKKYFNYVIKIFQENNILFLDLFPVIENVLKKYSIRELWANPGDGHPGNSVTDVYAQNAFYYLVNELKKIHN